MRIGAEATAGVHRRQKRGANYSRRRAGCPEAPDECVRTHPRAASAVQSLPRVRYSAALESRSARWRADRESEAGAIGFCWLLGLPMGVVGEARKWVRRAAGQTGRSGTGSLLVSGTGLGAQVLLLGTASRGRTARMELEAELELESKVRSVLCVACVLCGRAEKGGRRRGLVRYRVVGMGSRYVGRSSPEAQHDPGLDVSRRNVQRVRSGGGGGRKAAMDGQEGD